MIGSWLRGASRSIAAKLVAGFAFAYILVFVPVGYFHYRSLSDELQRADAETLRGKLKVVDHFVDETAVTGDLAALKHHLDDALIGHDDLSVWLFDKSGRLLYGASPMPAISPKSSVDQVSIVRGDGLVLDGLRRDWSASSAATIHRGVVGLDTGPRQRLLHQQGKSIAWIGAAGLLVAILLGAIVATRGLKPIRRLSVEASRIDAKSSGQRLSTPTGNDELEGLVSAFNGVLDRMNAIYLQMESFNADVAHELRRPLTNLISGFELAVSNTRTPAELREAMGEGLEELQSMKSLINDMLFVARADTGERASDIQVVSVANEVTHVAEIFEATLEELGVGLRVEGDAVVSCNPRLIRRAIGNLVSNALNFASAPSVVVVFVDEHAETVWIKVANRGEPVPQHVLDRMFTRFFRADPSRAARGESHGLGLAIVKAIAQMHDGTVAAERRGDTTLVGFSVKRNMTEVDQSIERPESGRPNVLSPR